MTVEKIMQDPEWMGTFPSNVRWGEDSKTIYFKYNLQKDPEDSLYKIALSDKNKIEKVAYAEEKRLIPGSGDFNKKRDKKVYVKDDALILYSLTDKSSRELIELSGINNPQFMSDENKISFSLDDNIFVYNLQNGSINKITNISSGEKSDNETKLNDKDDWVRNENLGLLEVVQQREDKREASKNYRSQTAGEPFTFYTGKRSVSNLQLSPDGKFATFSLFTRTDNKRTDVPNYVDASGYTANLPARSKVGDDPTKVELAVYNLEKDTIYMVQTNELPGIKDLPDYTADYPDKEWEEKEREVIPSGPYFSDNGTQAVVNVRSQDNKDRWIALLDLETGDLKNLDRQRDEAWIAGPGIGYSFSGGTMGWLPDNRNIYFQSEET
ncbi:hypothetical protein [Antarcticibacterium sp. 1MA-6-2]|uniref:hypothetical protein n=1 Tax=Antarcticibacterium sp. 1MA-6-2 TaxID=2908210 RepID=UPI0038FCD2F0